MPAKPCTVTPSYLVAYLTPTDETDGARVQGHAHPRMPDAYSIVVWNADARTSPWQRAGSMEHHHRGLSLHSSSHASQANARCLTLVGTLSIPTCAC